MPHGWDPQGDRCWNIFASAVDYPEASSTSRARLHERGKAGGESKLLQPLDLIYFGQMNGT
jgi:hypothetical protein